MVMKSRTVPVGQVTQWLSGGTPNRSVAEYWVGEIPWISASTLKGSEIHESDQHLTPEAVAVGSKMAPVGATLFLVRGSALHNEIRAGLVVAPVCFNQDVKALVPSPRIVPKFLTYSLLGRKQDLLKLVSTAGNSAGVLDTKLVQSFEIFLPPNPEQRAIAEALSDVDGLLGALDALIAKKRDIKQAAMQQLLTGKTCLPGFSGEWTEKPLIDLAAVTMGQSPPSISYNLRGEGLPLVQGKADIADRRTLDRVWTTQVSKRCDSGDLLLTVRAPVGTVAVARKAACLGRGVCGLKPFDSSAFLFHALVYAEDRWRILEQGSTFTAANSKQVGQFRLRVPTDENEQRAIAAVLSDMDAEIAVLERRRDKTLAIKQGMMQQLLSGRVRLVKLEEVTAQTAVTVSVARKHNWQFNEAVVISALIRKFGSKQYPLGRMRYTKLSYLLHRREEGYAEGYLKKAAGPYNPRTRYGGPEKIALQNDYVRQYKSGKRQGFVAGTNVDEAERYFDKWYGSEVLQWLEKFRYKTNDDLELLTTVDMAAEELRGTGEEVSVESVREVIHRHPEWNPKLDRPIFTDVNLARAIEICRTLFAVGGDEVAP